MLNENNDIEIEKIFAVSPILRLSFLQDIFKNLGFNVSQTESKYFLAKFPEAKSVYQSQLPVETLLTKEYGEKLEEITNQEKEKNENTLGEI